MTLPISYFRFYFPEYVLKTRLPPNCATGFLDRLKGRISERYGLFCIVLTKAPPGYAGGRKELSRNLIKITTPTQPPPGENLGGGLVNTYIRKKGTTKARSFLREKRM